MTIPVVGDHRADLVASAAEHARNVLRSSASEHGFVAAANDAHYNLWTRDAAFSSMGANVSGDPDLLRTVRDGLLTIAAMQAELGQIPDSAWPADGYWDFGESGATDATALFIIAAVQHLTAQPSAALRAQLWPHLERAFHWLCHQDANQFGLIDSPEAADWMDAAITRSGKVMYVNALYVHSAACMALVAPGRAGEEYDERARRLRRKFNLLFWPELGADYAGMLEGTPYPAGTRVAFPHPASPAAHQAAVRDDRAHYLSHVQWGRFVDECDVLGNVLAVLFDIPDATRARTIMEFLHAGDAAQPYPCRTYLTPFTPATDRWGMHKIVAEEFQSERWRNPAGTYHNGGVWPFIGGLYVAALHHVGMITEAAAELARLAEANRLAAPGGGPADWGFHEWIDSATRAPGGARDQTWSAGTFLLAHSLVEPGPAPRRDTASP